MQTDFRTFLADIHLAMPWRRFGDGLWMFSLAREVVPPHLKGFLRPNHSIMTLSTPGECRVQYGPVAVVAISERAGERWKPKNATMRDFRSFIDFYRFAKFNPCVPTRVRYPLATYNVGLCEAVKINCQADQKRFCYFLSDEGHGRALFLANVMVTTKSLNTPRFPWRYAREAGLRWMIQQCTTNTDNACENMASPNWVCQWFPYLRPLEEDGRRAPLPGSVLVVHEDSKSTRPPSPPLTGNTLANMRRQGNQLIFST